MQRLLASSVLLACGLVGGCCDRAAPGASPDPNKTAPRPVCELADAELLKIARDLLERLGLIQHGERRPMIVAWRSRRAHTGCPEAAIRALVSIRGVEGEVGLYLDGRNGQFQTFINHALGDLAVRRPPVVDPQWSRERAMEEALRYRKEILPPGAEKLLGPPEIEWRPTNREDEFRTRREPGSWHVNWYRHLRGHPFARDHVRFQILEEGGLLSAGLNLESMECPTDVLLSPPQARDLARRCLPQCVVLEDVFVHSTVVRRVVSEKLWIVNPTYYFDPNRRRESGSDTRLAYKFVFEMQDADRGHTMLHVWIDAATGENLGGGSY